MQFGNLLRQSIKIKNLLAFWKRHFGNNSKQRDFGYVSKISKQINFGKVSKYLN